MEYLKKLACLPLISTIGLHSSYSLHSSSLPHSFSPFLCLHSILPYFFTLFYMGKAYVMFQHTLLSLFPCFALFNRSCRIFVSRMTTKKSKQSKTHTHLKKKKIVKKNVCNGENMFLFTPTAALAELCCHCFPTELAFPNLGIPISLSDRIFLFFLRRCAFFKCQ